MKKRHSLQKKIVASTIAAAVSGILAQHAYAQSADASLRGKAPANTEVTAKNTETGLVRHVKAGADGSYSVIGLPPGQEFVLTEKAPFQSLAALPLDVYLQHAYAARPDYQAAQSRVHAAELSRQGASAGRYPSLDVNANLGDIGVTPSQSNGTWQVNGSLNIPIFAGNKVHGEVLEADAQLKQARSQLGDLRGRIDYEVRTALLDLNAAAEQVDVARSSVELAEEALTQSQDRFSAGVTDNLEVVQAQESVASAHESYIQSLYAQNLSKVELAYAIGDAEAGVKRFLKGNQ